jgi:hypothetical protein
LITTIADKFSCSLCSKKSLPVNIIQRQHSKVPRSLFHLIERKAIQRILSSDRNKIQVRLRMKSLESTPQKWRAPPNPHAAIADHYFPDIGIGGASLSIRVYVSSDANKFGIKFYRPGFGSGCWENASRPFLISEVHFCVIFTRHKKRRGIKTICVNARAPAIYSYPAKCTRCAHHVQMYGRGAGGAAPFKC